MWLWYGVVKLETRCDSVRDGTEGRLYDALGAKNCDHKLTRGAPLCRALNSLFGG